jgi:hypothetical protein
MGRWFPGFRPASAEQTRDWRESLKALWRNPDRTETPAYHELNNAQDALRWQLSRTQQSWHFQRALTEHDREQTRERRAARQLRRGRSRT